MWLALQFSIVVFVEQKCQSIWNQGNCVLIENAWGVSCLSASLPVLRAQCFLLRILLFSLLAIFNNDSQVIEVGYIRLLTLMFAHIFSLCYEVLSGYLRGFGISLLPAVLTVIGVCGVRLSWVYWVFPQSPNFQTIMAAFPICLSITALLLLITVLCCRPARKYSLQKSE